MSATPVSLGVILQRVIEARTDAVAELERAVRADEPDAVHRYRVALRRLRSVLAGFSREVRTVTAGSGLDVKAVSHRLRSLARAFGLARDAEVDADLIAARLDGADGAAAQTRDLLVAAATADYRRRRVEAVALLDAGGPHTLHAVLTALAVAVGEAAAADGGAGTGGEGGDDAADAEDTDRGPSVTDDAAVALARAVERQAADVLHLADAADAVGRADPEGYTAALHEVRKKAKRLRYTVEEITGHGVEVTDGLADVVDAAHRVQQHLGAHHDSVGLAAFVRATVERATVPFPPAVALAAGITAGAEEAVQGAALADYETARRDLQHALSG